VNRRASPYRLKNYGGNDDPFTKVKFTIPPFYGLYNVVAYLDWKMTVDNRFSLHLVPEQHCVRHATSEFKDFAIIWWNELSTFIYNLIHGIG
jgi:hypothetical protein